MSKIGSTEETAAAGPRLQKTYVITGGANGIGRTAAEILRARGDRVIVIDKQQGDITVDLSTAEGRQTAVGAVFSECPDGIDGLVCAAGIASPTTRNSSVISVNYFGNVAVIDGLFPLLERKQGSCVTVSSASLTWGKQDQAGYLADLITACGDETRIAELVDAFPPEKALMLYHVSKIALARWVRRTSADWGARGVRMTIVAPGCVDTQLNAPPKGVKPNESFHRTIPLFHGTGRIIPPADIGEVIVYLLDKESRGLSGCTVIADAGQDAFLNPERVCM